LSKHKSRHNGKPSRTTQAIKMAAHLSGRPPFFATDCDFSPGRGPTDPASRLAGADKQLPVLFREFARAPVYSSGRENYPLPGPVVAGALLRTRPAYHKLSAASQPACRARHLPFRWVPGLAAAHRRLEMGSQRGSLGRADPRAYSQGRRPLRKWVCRPLRRSICPTQPGLKSDQCREKN
jgi:hypothetical protein